MIFSKEEAVKQALEYADQGFLCVEAVLKTLADLKGVESNYIPAISTGMAAGVARTSQICGAVTGAILGLGLWFGRNEPVANDRRPYWYSRLLIERWKEIYPDTNCTVLLGVDLDKPEEYAISQENNYWETKCKKYIKDAVALAIDILEDDTSAR